MAHADATVDLPHHLAQKAHKPKPHIPAEYKLERPISKPHGPDQSNPIVFYDVWWVLVLRISTTTLLSSPVKYACTL